MKSRGNIIAAAEEDTIRILASDGSALQIPAAMILAVDYLFRYCFAEASSFELDLVEDETFQGWEATVDNPNSIESLSLDGDELLLGHGDTPWGAIVALAMRLKKEIQEIKDA